MGFWNGSSFRSYFDNLGNVFFGNPSGARIEYNYSANRLRGLNSSSVVQWYADGSTGKLYAGGGNVTLDAGGINIGAVASTGSELLTFGSEEFTQGLVSSFGGYRTALLYHKYSTSNQIGLLVRNAGDPNAGNYNAGIFVRQISYAGSIYLQAANIYLQTPAAGAAAVSVTGTLSATSTITGGAFTTGGTITGGAGVFSGALSAGSLGSWSSLSFGAGWGNYTPAGYATCAYRRFGDLVMVKGLALLSSGTNATIGTLPAGYRPPTNGQVIKTVHASTGVIRVDITPAGAINVVGGATTSMWVAINFDFSTSS